MSHLLMQRADPIPNERNVEIPMHDHRADHPISNRRAGLFYRVLYALSGRVFCGTDGVPKPAIYPLRSAVSAARCDLYKVRTRSLNEALQRTELPAVLLICGDLN